MTMLVATTHDALKQGQEQLAVWCSRKLEGLASEQTEAQESLEAAKKNKWRTVPFKRQLKRIEARQVFFSKVSQALQAGYLIMPNLPMDVFAIRTKAEIPRGTATKHAWEDFSQQSQRLPVGAGENKSPVPARETWESTTENNGKTEIVKYTEPVEFQEIDFPLQIAKPHIMSATQAALSLKLFDEIGIAQNTSERGDPFVVGRLRHPTSDLRGGASFFIAWAFDPENWV